MASESHYAPHYHRALMDSHQAYHTWKAPSDLSPNAQRAMRTPHSMPKDLVQSPIMVPVDTHSRAYSHAPWSQEYTEPRPAYGYPSCDAYNPPWYWNGAAPPPTRTASTSSSLEDGVRPPPVAVGSGHFIEPGYPSPMLHQVPENGPSQCNSGYSHYDGTVSQQGSQHGSPTSSSPPWGGNPLQQIQAVPDSCPEEYPSPTEPVGGGGCPQPYSYPSPVSVQRGANEEYPPLDYAGTISMECNKVREDNKQSTEAFPDHRASHPSASPATKPTVMEPAPVTRSPKSRRKSATVGPASTIRKRTPARRPDPAAPRPISSTAKGSSSNNSGKARCPHCSETARGRTALQRHVAAAHTRPFTCSFNIYGCPATFGAKNEWKRHVTSQHLRLGVWRCDMDRCRPEHAAPPLSKNGHAPTRKGRGAREAVNGHDDDDSEASASEEDEEEPSYNEFNRKDLFTQHVRRMHGPVKAASNAEHNAFRPQVAQAASRCYIAQRGLPTEATCGYCAADSTKPEPVVFRGQNAWEVRMEHVGRHLEAMRDVDVDAKGSRNPGHWEEDLGLRQWLLNEGLLEGSPENGWSLVGV